jgi:predicted membrane protein
MSNPMRFFIIVESLLFLLALWQVVTNPPILAALIIGGFLIGATIRKRKRSRFARTFCIIGSIVVLISLINSPVLWIMAVFALIFIGLKGVEISGVDITKNAFWQKRHMMIVETKEPGLHDDRKKKQKLFGNERVGGQVYEWDDININILAGDTIIDLGNTLLPKTDNVIMIRKGVGKTRVLVPMGVGVQIEHGAVLGNILFEEEKIDLHNESLTLYSKNFDQTTRHLKIVSNTLIGDIEVIVV